MSSISKDNQMQIIRISVIERFLIHNASARKPMTEWFKKAEMANWRSFADVKNTFNSVDYKKPYLIFDIAGNNYRMLTQVDYPIQTITVIKIGTHKEYEKWKL
jgi:mRNA interferase HigB